MNPEQPINFLIVDDLDANILALEALLQRDGLRVLKARSGAEALEVLLIHQVSLAFLDVQMPGMSGFELAEIMRSTERTRGVPIIFLTAGGLDPQRRMKGYEMGAVDFLFKPIEAPVLLNKAGIFFELARQRQQLRQNEMLLTDVNEQLAHRVEELALADRSKDEFLAMLAHELRNPLAPLRNAWEILRTDHPDTTGDREHALEIIDRQIGNMSRMIDDLLDVSRITEGKIELRKHPVALDPVLNAALSVVRTLCAANEQHLTVTLPPEPVYLDADPTRLEQVFGNLLGNAAKYSGHGCHISLTVERLPRSSPPQVVVRIRDDGAGIEPELLPHIFGLFVQATRSLDRSHGGLGIGLTLVERLVHLHGGRVEARSEGLGHGSEFLVYLPILAEAPRKTQPPRAPSKEESRRILIVDDNKDSARSLATLQTRRGHITHTVYTGPDALTAAADFLPEVVLLDIGLPGMDGFEVARRLRQMPALTGLLLIAMSGYGTPNDRETARKAGFDEYMVKPANLARLSELLMRGAG